MTPTLAGFIAFLRTVVGIATAVLPDNSPVISTAYDIATELVNLAINDASSTIYTYAVYNLGSSNVLNYGQDAVGAPLYQDGLPFFAYVRKKWNLLDPVFGIVQSSGDEGTSNSLVVPEAMKNLTLADLQYLKDPYGRQYLAFAQKFGPTVFGMT